MIIPASAELSLCDRYRYHLQRTWEATGPRICFIMLNPSTADALEDDATIRVCKGRATHMGYTGIDVVNLFALRSTNPANLYRGSWIISEGGAPDRNDEFIERYARAAPLVICAWGKHGALLDRGTIVLRCLRRWGIKPMALRLNKDGSPAHPLRIGYDQYPFYF